MAYATIAGLRVEVGLCTTFLPMLIYAAFGTADTRREHQHYDRYLGGGTLTRSSQMASHLADSFVHPDALVGSILVPSLLRPGFITNFISEPMLVGFKLESDS
jgi:hypothetical protein